MRKPVAHRAASWSGAVACSQCSGLSGSAGWSFSAGAPQKARGSFLGDPGVGVGVVCQGLAPLDQGDPDALVSRVRASPSEEDVKDGLVEAFLWAAKVP